MSLRERRTVIVYPFCAALYPVLALAAKNVDQLVHISDVVPPLAISLVLAFVSWLASRAFSPDVHVRGVITLLIVLWFGTHGYLGTMLFAGRLLDDPRAELMLAATTLLLVSLISAVAAKRRFVGPGMTRYLNLSVAILLLFPLTSLALYFGRGGSAQVVQKEPAHTYRETAIAHPDIYLIILDKYTGRESLLKHHGFDNSTFENELRRRGFIVPRAARSNYTQTALTLASMLNWKHLEQDTGDRTRGTERWRLYRMIEDNRTWRFLESRGYRFVFFPTAYRATAKNDHADLQIPAPQAIGSEFMRVWFVSTILAPLVRASCEIVSCPQGSGLFVPESASLIDWKFDRLTQLPDSAGPLFVLAHLLVPHEPYVYWADCQHRRPLWPTRHSRGEVEQAAYVEQINCVNSKLLPLVDSLLARSRTPPVILLQSDHGHGRRGLPRSLADTPWDSVLERTDIFAAYYLPAGGDRILYDSITPINILPLTLNHYFGSDIPLQEDGVYWSSSVKPFRFTRIENRLNPQ